LSAAPRRGLGRGLGALLGDEGPVVAAGTQGPTEIPVDLIGPNPRQPRTTFDAQTQATLQASIATFGVLVPIIVRRRGERYELIAGERRWRAAAAAGLRAIPAIVREAQDVESLELAMIENLQREDLDPLEEAMGFQHLIDDYGFTQERVAERVGRARPSVANALRLLTLPEEIQALLRSRALSAGHAKALLAFPERQRLAMAKRAAQTGMSVRMLERLAQRKSTPRKPALRDEDGNLAAAAERLRYRLATHVAFHRTGAGGRIEIRYSDETDLIRLVDIILGEA
jgi:ParB family transcriptional regulator, chromosome partitioning protein